MERPGLDVSVLPVREQGHPRKVSELRLRFGGRARGVMLMSERQDGWYCVRWPHMPDSAGGPIVPGPWRPSAYDSANDEWIDQGLHRRQPPLVIGPRIIMDDDDEPSECPDDPPAPQAAVDLAGFCKAHHEPRCAECLIHELESLRARVALLESAAGSVLPFVFDKGCVAIQGHGGEVTSRGSAARALNKALDEAREKEGSHERV